MANSRKEELMEYVSLLRGLLVDNFKCEMELKQALKELHELMLKEKPKTFVMVFENNLDDVEESVELFKRILGNDVSVSRSNPSEYEVRSGSTTVSIFSKFVSMDKLRGYSPDFIINNTNIDLDVIGIKTK